eukprot:1144046-Pelagomonas_calceolata.AAC.1
MESIENKNSPHSQVMKPEIFLYFQCPNNEGEEKKQRQMKFSLRQLKRGDTLAQKGRKFPPHKAGTSPAIMIMDQSLWSLRCSHRSN